MTQDKDLLLKDLCARLPYGVKAIVQQTNCLDSIRKISEKDIYSFRTGRPLEEDYGQHDYYKVVVTDIKPYLLPLSSMTDEQKKELDDTLISLSLKSLSDEISSEVIATYEIDFYNKNHFDYRGLIPKGLAIDATGLNVY